jgi:hypothetical protein
VRTATIAEPVIIVVAPSINSKGVRATSVYGLLYDAHLAGRRIVERSTTPFFDAARRLVAEGVDPSTPLIMRHSGSYHDALRATVGAAAKLTVEEGSRRPNLRPWKPRQAAAGASPMHQPEEVLLSERTEIAPAAEGAHLLAEVGE